MELINREEICCACLEYQLPLLQISDDTIKQVYKYFTNDYKDDIQLYLCSYCRHTFDKISKFKSTCLQSYLFLKKNLPCSKFDADTIKEEKALIQSNVLLSLSDVRSPSLPYDESIETDDPLSTNKPDENVIENTKIIHVEIKEENISVEFEERLSPAIDNNDIEFEEEVIRPATSVNSNDLTKLKTLKENKISTIKLFSDVTEIKVSQEDQAKEMEEKRQSEEYLEAVYKCHDCALNFEDQIILKKHMLKHKKVEGFLECWLCHMWLPQSDMPVHSLVHSTRYVCNLCNYKTHSYDSMKGHLERHAGITHSCNLCEKVYKNRSALLKHIRGHKCDKNFKCEQCDEAFSTKSLLQEHQFYHTGIRPYSCEQCDKSFPTKNKLQGHQYVHTELRPYSCDECGKTFKRKTHYSIHLETHNVITGEYYCVECDMSFKSERYLNAHLRNRSKHIDPSQLNFSCNQCSKKFISQKKLDSHIQTSHEKIPKFACDICGSLFITRSGQYSHKRTVHKGYVMPLKYGCSTCDKHFSSKKQLINHIRIHTGERPFKCDFCDWKFKQKSTLETHIKLKHLKIKKNDLDKKSKTESISVSTTV